MVPLIISLIASSGIVLIKFLIPYCLHFLGLKHDPPLVKSPLIIGLEWLFVFIVISLFIIISEYLQPDKFVLLVIFAFFFPIFTSFEFMVRPLLLRFQSNLEEEASLSRWLSDTYGIKLSIYSFEGELVNAYATGAVPFSNTIILGQSLVEKLDDTSVKAIILHEAGHLKLNHLFYLYLGNIISCALFGFLLDFLFKMNMTPEWVKVIVIVLSAAFCSGLIFELIPGFFRKQFEYQADLFSSARVGAATYKEALKQLDRISEGRVSKGGYSHPPLKERVRNIGSVS